MKKKFNLFGLLCVVAVFLVVAMIVATPAQAVNRTVTTIVANVSSSPVVGQSGWNDFVPQVSSDTDHQILRVEISVNRQEIQQVITLYDNATSTTALTKLWETELSTGNVVMPYVIPFTDRFPLYATDGVLIRKSNVLGNVRAVIYEK